MHIKAPAIASRVNTRTIVPIYDMKYHSPSDKIFLINLTTPYTLWHSVL